MIPPGERLWEKFSGTTSSPEFEKASPEDRIRAIFGIKTPHDVRFLSQFMERDVKLESFTQISPTTSSAVFRFKVERFYCNGAENLHGGAQATMYDMLTSITMQGIGRRDFWMNGGVSRSLSCTYLRPAPVGIDVLCEVEVMSAGRTLCNMRAVMKRATDGAVISTCEHDKAAVPTKPGWDAPKL